MIPGAAVVARPGGGITLGAGICGAREHEWPFVRLQFAQPIIRGTHVLHAVDIVNGTMIERGSIVEAVPGVKRHGFIGAKEQRWFIHVIPEARRPHPDEVFLESAPPVPPAGPSKNRKHPPAGPNRTDA